MNLIILITLLITVCLLIRFEIKLNEIQTNIDLHEEIGYDRGCYETMKELGVFEKKEDDNR